MELITRYFLLFCGIFLLLEADLGQRRWFRPLVGGLLLTFLLLNGWSKRKRLGGIAAVFLTLSGVIEFSQYFYCLGRPEINDVIHNTLDGVLGFGYVISQAAAENHNRFGNAKGGSISGHTGYPSL